MTATTRAPGTAPLLYRVPDALKMLGISRAYLYEQIRARRIRTVKQGRATCFTTEALAEYVTLLETEARHDDKAA